MTCAGRLRGLSAVVPAYNEAGNIGRVVDALCTVLPAVAGHHEVIVVDDGSSDGRDRWWRGGRACGCAT